MRRTGFVALCASVPARTPAKADQCQNVGLYCWSTQTARNMRSTKPGTLFRAYKANSCQEQVGLNGHMPTADGPVAAVRLPGSDDGPKANAFTHPLLSSDGELRGADFNHADGGQALSSPSEGDLFLIRVKGDRYGIGETVIPGN